MGETPPAATGAGPQKTQRGRALLHQSSRQSYRRRFLLALLIVSFFLAVMYLFSLPKKFLIGFYHCFKGTDHQTDRSGDRSEGGHQFQCGDRHQSC